jgi:hypothetical protein
MLRPSGCICLLFRAKFYCSKPSRLDTNDVGPASLATTRFWPLPLSCAAESGRSVRGGDQVVNPGRNTACIAGRTWQTGVYYTQGFSRPPQPIQSTAFNLSLGSADGVPLLSLHSSATRSASRNRWYFCPFIFNSFRIAIFPTPLFSHLSALPPGFFQSCLS